MIVHAFCGHVILGGPEDSSVNKEINDLDHNEGGDTIRSPDVQVGWLKGM